MKRPWLAALLNFLFYGIGYIYVGKRVLLGVLLFVAGLIESIMVFYMDLMHPALITASLIAGIAFAYDGYRNAQEVNMSKVSP